MVAFSLTLVCWGLCVSHPLLLFSASSKTGHGGSLVELCAGGGEAMGAAPGCPWSESERDSCSDSVKEEVGKENALIGSSHDFQDWVIPTCNRVEYLDWQLNDWVGGRPHKHGGWSALPGSFYANSGYIWCHQHKLAAPKNQEESLIFVHRLQSTQSAIFI